MTSKEMQKEYSIRIYMQLAEMFKSDCKNKIEAESLDANDFFHALTIASTILYDKMTGEDINVLEFNHLQNRLIMQYETINEIE